MRLTGPAARKVAILLCACLLLVLYCGYFYQATKANTDLMAGRYALHMDELLSFDGVRRILHPQDAQGFLWAVTDGNDQRYGRSLWNSIAAFSYLPDRIWGAPGQILAGRMLQVLLLFTSFLIFAFGLLRSWPLRLALSIALLTLPWVDYFMVMPKPEPLQLFFLSLFCLYFFRNGMRFGWYWLFIGLAFGTKISTLPALLVFMCAGLLASDWRDNRRETVIRIEVAGLCFLGGLTIAVPILFKPILLLVVAYILLSRLPIVIALRGLLICVAAAVIAKKTAHSWQLWVRSTFLNTKHGSDDASINASRWLYHFFDNYLGSSSLFAALLAVFGGVLIVHAILRNRGGRPLFKLGQPDTGLIVLLAGSALNASIFVAAHRLWGYYLVPGTLLAIVGLFLMLDTLSMAEKDAPSRFHVTGALAGYALTLTIVFLALALWLPVSMKTLDSIAHRTSDEDYAKQETSYHRVIAFLDERAKHAPRKLVVAYDPLLFFPDPDKPYKIAEFYGAFVDWEDPPDIVVFSEIHTGRKTPPLTTTNRDLYQAERTGYARQVIEPGAACQVAVCLQREMVLPNGGEVLVRIPARTAAPQ